MPSTLAQTIQIADSYALGDPMQPASIEQAGNQDEAGPSRQQDRQDFRHKRREDHRHGSYQVAAVEQSNEGTGRGPKPRFSGSKRPWDKNGGQNGRRSKQQNSGWTYESMLDQPCSFHTSAGGPPANHTSRQCSWASRMAREGLGARPQAPTPLTGANAQALQPMPRVNPGPPGPMPAPQ